MIKIVVIGDQDQERDRICTGLSIQDDFEIAGFGQDGYDTLKLAADLQPDIIIIDLREDNIDGPELVPLINRKSPATAVIILHANDDDDDDIYAGKALFAGARGYLAKKNMEKLADSVRTVYQGGYFFTGALIPQMFRTVSKRNKYRNFPSAKKTRQAIPPNMNRTELQIITFIGKGYSNKEIAERLHLKPGTVRNYLSSAMHKAGLQNRTQAAIFALTNGLTNSGEV
jgi:DNA-binding NarL/FixJ family response regulator